MQGHLRHKSETHPTALAPVRSGTGAHRLALYHMWSQQSDWRPSYVGKVSVADRAHSAATPIRTRSLFSPLPYQSLELAQIFNRATITPVPSPKPETRIIPCKRCGLHTRHERQEWMQRPLPLLLLTGRVKVVSPGGAPSAESTDPRGRSTGRNERHIPLPGRQEQVAQGSHRLPTTQAVKDHQRDGLTSTR